MADTGAAVKLRVIAAAEPAVVRACHLQVGVQDLMEVDRAAVVAAQAVAAVAAVDLEAAVVVAADVDDKIFRI